MLHITTTGGQDVWINPAQIVSIGVDGSHHGKTVIRTTGTIRNSPLIYTTDEAPTDLLVRLGVGLGGE